MNKKTLVSNDRGSRTLKRSLWPQGKTTTLTDLPKEIQTMIFSGVLHAVDYETFGPKTVDHAIMYVDEPIKGPLCVDLSDRCHFHGMRNAILSMKVLQSGDLSALVMSLKGSQRKLGARKRELTKLMKDSGQIVGRGVVLVSPSYIDRRDALMVITDWLDAVNLSLVALA